MTKETQVCTECKLRIQYAYRKFTEGKGYTWWSDCPGREAGGISCFDQYCDFIRQYKLGPLKPAWPSISIDNSVNILRERK